MTDEIVEDRRAAPSVLDVEVTALAAGGDGVARDSNGRVTFVPRSAPGDLVRVRLVKQTKSFARGELAEYRLAHAARADLCRQLGRKKEARTAYERALALTRQEPERRFLQRRLNEVS